MTAPVAAAAARTGGTRAAAARGAGGRATAAGKGRKAPGITDTSEKVGRPVVGLPPEEEQAGAETTSTSTSSPSGGRSFDVRVSNAGGGFVLGAFAYVLGLTYLRGGRPAVTAWLKAKFLNEVP